MPEIAEPGERECLTFAFEAGRQYGVKQAMNFVVVAYDEPTIAREVGKYVLPNRQWRRRFNKAILEGKDA